jgi:Zn-dependent protease
VFFLALLAHEVSHAMVALRNGLPVEGITLWLFGGVARLGGEARMPGAELRIAGVGPLVSRAVAARVVGDGGPVPSRARRRSDSPIQSDRKSI